MRSPVSRSTLLAPHAARRLSLAGPMTALLLVLAACSSSPAATTSNTLSATATAAATATATATATESAAASASAVTGETVKLVSLAFDPLKLTIKVGTTVTFRNFDAFEHTATNGKDGLADAHALFDIDLPANASGTYTFTKAGTFPVTCKVHPDMNMTIVVQ